MSAMRARKQDLDRFYTLIEFEKLPEFNERYELIDGRLIEKPMVTFKHGRIAGLLIRAFYIFDPEEKVGVIAPEVNIALGPNDSPAPDVAIWKKERRPADTHRAAPLPDLAIEIWSPTDLTKRGLENARAKARRYLAGGVPLVWAINPENQTVEIYRPGYDTPDVLGVNDLLEGEDIIPGFKVAIASLFE